MAKKKKPDVEVSNHGTIFMFALLTEQAREWVEENVAGEKQFLGGSLAVEHRFAHELAEGMLDAGLIVK